MPCEDGGGISNIFAGKDLHSIAFHAGLNKGELLSLLMLLSKEGPLNNAALSTQGMSHININTAHYVRTGDAVEAADVAVDDEDWADGIASLSFEVMVRKVIERAIRDEEKRKKVFEIIIQTIKMRQ